MIANPQVRFYYEQSREFVKQLNPQLLRKKLRHAPELVLELINDCLQLNPANRKSASELLKS